MYLFYLDECNDNSGHHHDKPFLELIMDPRGHVQDMNSLKRQGIPVQHSTISPKVCMEIVKDLNTPSGKGKISSLASLINFTQAKNC